MTLARILLIALVLAAAGRFAAGQTFSGSDLSYRSSGTDAGTDWVLSENGYVGTFFTIASPGDVTITAQAAGTAGGGADPRMKIVVADTQFDFNVSAGFNDYGRTFNLPAGTYFVRTEFNNDVPTADRQLTVRDLTISGATVSNTTSTTTNNTNALAAADTYVEHFRRGPARVALVGLAPGTPVDVRLKRHAFNFGVNLPGSNVSQLTNGRLDNPNFTGFINEHFNMVVPSNAGKWQNTNGANNMAGVDLILDYAEQNNMRARMHNLIWGNQQPNNINTLINQAAGGDQSAIDNLRNAISGRIDYYVGDGDGNPNDGDRARRYLELDVYNESVHTGVNEPNSYWNIYGADGIAEIFDEIAQAVTAAGAQTKLYLNEYNILQNGFDEYGNWYREHIEEIENADGDPFNQTVSGIGMQYYVRDGHSASYMQQVLQNLSVIGLPLSLTEFGVQGNVTNETNAARYVTEAMRMIFGAASAETFMYWGFWESATDPNLQGSSVLVDNDWNLTTVGEAWSALTSSWDTELSIQVGEDGTIDFTGFYGDYEITIGGQSFDLDLRKGTTQYSLVVAPGDYNGDGMVDAADYIVWRQAVDTADLRADGNGDLVIDDDDYDVWRTYFGTSYAGGGATAQVPEPAGVTLLLIAALAAGAWRHRAST